MLKIDIHVLGRVEKALGIKLYDEQIAYILHDGPYWFGGRRTGKTLAYCVKLALSEGAPLNASEPWNISDPDCGAPENKYNYARWFRRFFLDIWHSLKDAGLPVREINAAI